MKNLLFILAAITVSSCTSEPIYNSQNESSSNSKCGVIVTTGEDSRGDYIIVKMPNYTYQKDRYKVADYSIYNLNSTICNFAGLEKQPL